jgi:bacterioferritin (cytochrome b1)
MTLGSFINPLQQREAQLVDRSYPTIDTSNMNNRLLDTISNLPQLQAQGRKLAQQQQIQEGVSQIYSQPNLSTSQRLQQVGDVYGRAGAGAEALAANTAYEDQKDKDLKQKIETFTAVGKLLGNVYQSSLQESPDDKEEAIKKVNNLLDGLIKSGIGKDVEDALRGMAQSGYEFSLSNDNERDLRVVDNQDGTQSIVDIAKYLPKNKSSIVIEGSATGVETLAQAKAKAQMRSEIALNQT